MRYPPCPNCGHELPIGVFYDELRARRLPTFGIDRISTSPRFRKDPHTQQDVPIQFSITCARCGATSAVDTSTQDRFLLVIALVLAVACGLLLLFARPLNAMKIIVCVVLYFGALTSIYRVMSAFTTPMMKATLTSMPGPEFENETRAERRTRLDHDMFVEIAALGPEFERVDEPEPLEPDLADVASRIDAAHAAAPPSGFVRPEYERAEEEDLERAKVACAKCGEMNQRDFEKCWNCESALPERG